MVNSLKIAAVFIGTFVGAGFASGQEIMQYFVVYGKAGIGGVAASSIIFGIFCYITMYNLWVMGEDDYFKETNRSFAFKFMYCAYMIMIFCTMITASGEMLKESAGLPKILGVLGMVVLCDFIICCGSNGIVRLNTIVTPVIVIGILVLCAISLLTNTVSAVAGTDVAVSSLVYVSYNTITLASVAAGMGNLIKNKKTIFYASLWSSMTILVLVTGMFFMLYRMPVISEMPVLDALSENLIWIYVPVLGCAMVTTASANGYGIVAMKKQKFLYVALLSIASILFSLLSFSFIVKYFYGLFGLAGVFVMFDNLRIFVKNKKNEEKTNKREKY